MPALSSRRVPLAAQERSIADELLAWYDRHRRVLPWRAKPGERADPYRVWLSEIMLQQTTVKAVIPYYTAFLGRWDTVEALAAAPVEAVMQAWAGLGYYSRARNLHACAKMVVQDHGGRFPQTEAGLRTLPGIGTYTAAAIAAIAFGRDAVVVDGNVERVMARLAAVTTPLPQAKGALAALMGAATPAGRAGDFAQAVMDLGSSLCTPRSPACAICPVRPHCAAVRLGLQDEVPYRLAKTKTVIRHGTAYYVTRTDGAVLMRTRPPRGLLGGMVELPGTAWTLTETLAPPLPVLRAGERHAGRVTHTFTHFTLLLDVVERQDLTDLDVLVSEGARWVLADNLDAEALPTLMRNALSAATAQTTDHKVNPPARCPASRKRRRS